MGVTLRRRVNASHAVAVTRTIGAAMSASVLTIANSGMNARGGPVLSGRPPVPPLRTGFGLLLEHLIGYLHEAASLIGMTLASHAVEQATIDG